MELSQLTDTSKFEQIIDYISKTYSRKGILYPLFKHSKNDNSLLIHLKFKRNTDLNPLADDILFSIFLSHDYPISYPFVRCLTNFGFPTLFDNRNLLFSIIHHNWININPTKITEPVEEIILQIPHFINRLLENTQNKILVYYGDYKIDMIYDINEFLCNSSLDLYKVIHYSKSKNNQSEKEMEKYVIVTDIYFLLFDPAPKSKNIGKLVFWGDIRPIVTWTSGFQNDRESVKLEWKNNNKAILFEISILNKLNSVFIESTMKKVKELKEKFKIVQDDISKPSDEELITKETLLNSTDVDKLVLLIQYKEQLLSKQRSLNLTRELMSLYQKVIELLSANGDMNFKTYLEKLHLMLADQNIQGELERESTENSKTLFEMSVSYDEDETK